MVYICYIPLFFTTMAFSLLLPGGKSNELPTPTIPPPPPNTPNNEMPESRRFGMTYLKREVASNCSESFENESNLIPKQIRWQFH
jgi:hypothetical protein